MRYVNHALICAAALAVSACGSAPRAAAANNMAAAGNDAAGNTAANAGNPAPGSNAAATAASGPDANGIADVELTTSDGRRVLSRQLTGETVQAPGERLMNADERQEIERATGRPYEEGDSIYGRARPAPAR
jgi:hypothetical protein